MKIGEIIRRKQPKEYKKLMDIKYRNNYTHEEFERMMRHDSYKRNRGAIRQVNNG